MRSKLLIYKQAWDVLAPITNVLYMRILDEGKQVNFSVTQN